MPSTDPPIGVLGAAVLRKIAWRLLPLLAVGYGVAYIDRTNLSFAALQMNDDLHFSASIYGLGAGLFSLSYCLLEIPSNLLLTRFGARRWLGRIMLTWGVLAVGMAFVRTPLQFYVMRFLLGAAEAGFFPGVLYYLKNWFPASHSGRAISRFYIAVPLGAAFMGAISGPLLELRGVAGLAGWQWLFLVEGLPAIALSAAVFFCLPDSREQVRWLNDAERSWLGAALGDTHGAAPAPGSLVTAAFRNPLVWTLGACNFLIMGASYAFAFSAPLLLKATTQWDATRISWFTSVTALSGAGAMLLNGWHSDRQAERHWHVAVPLAVMALCMGSIAAQVSPLLTLTAYVVYYMGVYAVQAAFWSIPSSRLQGRSAAVGLAAIGSIGLFGGFVGPTLWGRARDLTGNFHFGLWTLCIVYLTASVTMIVLSQAPGRVDRC